MKHFDCVLNGYYNLSDTQKIEFREAIEKYETSEKLTKTILELTAHIGCIGLETKSLGPLSSSTTCPCCQK